MSTHPIDIVIPWVDGSDPVWQADHAKYRASKSADNHPARLPGVGAVSLLVPRHRAERPVGAKGTPADLRTPACMAGA